MNRDQRIAEQLGMSHGAANHKLRKNILFNFLCRLSENVCFKCKKVIDNINDLSVEHKLPWEGRDAKLFWDLDNIAFSHLKCNTVHKISSGNKEIYLKCPIYIRAKTAPKNTAWCSGHQRFLPIENFHSNTRNVNQVASYCKDCRKTRLD